MDVSIASAGDQWLISDEEWEDSTETALAQQERCATYICPMHSAC
jgi:hypothetical protein